MSMTNEELLKIFKETALGKPFNLSENTVDRYLYYINQLITVSKKEIVDITKADIKLYLMGLKTSDSYYNANLSAFRTLFKMLSYHPLTEDMFTIDPTFGIISVKNVKNEKEQIILSSHQQSMMLKYAKNNRDRAILQLYLSCGIRAMELIELTLSQYKNRSDDNCIELTVTKGSHNRNIWLSEDVIESIDKYLVDRKESEYDNLFISNGGQPMDRSCISRTLKTIARKTRIFSDEEVSRIANHSCRRSCASTLLNEKDIPIDVVAEVLGHHGLGSIKRYAKTDNSRIKSAMVG